MFQKKIYRMVLFLVLGFMVTPGGMAKVNRQGQLNINTATVEELDLLPGVSPKKAQAIIDYRQKQAFKSLEELDGVKGFSQKSIEKLRPYAKIEGPSDLAVVGNEPKVGSTTESQAASSTESGASTAAASTAPTSSGEKEPGKK